MSRFVKAETTNVMSSSIINRRVEHGKGFRNDRDGVEVERFDSFENGINLKLNNFNNLFSQFFLHDFDGKRASFTHGIDVSFLFRVELVRNGKIKVEACGS